MPTSPRPSSSDLLAPIVALSIAVGLAPSPGAGQEPFDAGTLPIRPEATDWIETSRYADVMHVLRTVAAADDEMHLTTMGYTMEGRAIPLLVVGAPEATPEAVRRTGKVVVYLQGGIHSGEVPGKEALQMLVRELAGGARPAWRDRLVLLVNPIYNADGNERVALTNRPRQHGPLGGMGQRPNAMGLDLNRDHMKLDAPEARSLASMMTAYDPHIAVDLHTTNGTRHAYHLTYSPPLHPGVAPEITDLLVDRALPWITARSRAEDGFLMYHYGNAYERDGQAGWYTFDHRPRFNNNYVGLRNRIALLGEAYAYATFRERTLATRSFVDGILAWAGTNVDTVRAAVEAADRPVVGEELPTRATFRPADTLSTILMGEVAEERHPWTGRTILRRLDVVTPTEMREYTTFTATDTEVVPVRYFVPPEVAVAVERLAAHGVRSRVLTADETVEVEVFEIDSTAVSPREFQGHSEVELFGAWRPERRTVPAGTVEVRLDQPLGRLAFYLLEPRSDDGLVNWGLLDRWLEQERFPIVREPARE